MSGSFVIVPGASSGIGLGLAAICAREGVDLLIAADRPEIHTQRIRELGTEVTVVEPDLGTTDRVDRLWAVAARRPVAERHRKMTQPGSGQRAKG